MLPKPVYQGVQWLAIVWRVQIIPCVFLGRVAIYTRDPTVIVECLLRQVMDVRLVEVLLALNVQPALHLSLPAHAPRARPTSQPGLGFLIGPTAIHFTCPAVMLPTDLSDCAWLL